LTFDNLEFEVNVKLSKEDALKEGKLFGRQKIVKNVTGYALPGETTYIMGASGAGKTSLLNMLSDRISSRDGQKVTGDIMINDTLRLN
jgi:ABC-type multidrug transport system ATPase subunit